MKLLLGISIVLLSTLSFGKEKAHNRYPASSSLETMDSLARQCMSDLVTSGNKETCEKYEKAQHKIDSKTKADQCEVDKTRNVLDLEVEDCIAISRMAKVASELNGIAAPAIQDASSCKQTIRNRFCN